MLGPVIIYLENWLLLQSQVNFVHLKSQLNTLLRIWHGLFLFWWKLFKKMEVDVTELLNSYEVVPVSFSDPFKSLVVDPSTLELLRFLPIIGFIALIMAAVWRQSKRIPINAIADLSETKKND